MKHDDYLLVCLAEECAEIQKVISKILRFGLHNGYPGSDITNRQELSSEINDVIAIIDMLEQAKMLDRGDIENAIIHKIAKVRQYMEISRDCERLEDE